MSHWIPTGATRLTDALADDVLWHSSTHPVWNAFHSSTSPCQFPSPSILASVAMNTVHARELFPPLVQRYTYPMRRKNESSLKPFPLLSFWLTFMNRLHISQCNPKFKYRHERARCSTVTVWMNGFLVGFPASTPDSFWLILTEQPECSFKTVTQVSPPCL